MGVAGLRPWIASALLVGSFAACDGDVLVGEFVPEGAAGQGGAGGAGGAGGTGGTSGTGGVSVTTGIAEVTSSSSGGSAGASECVPRSCTNGPPFDCGNCLDDDGDGYIDAEDPDCLGPCHNTESSYFGNIPGQDGGKCQRDCYFDSDSGAGNDDCHWDRSCDRLEPEPDSCPYDPDSAESCDALAEAPASEKCLDKCLPLVPNGCDCFGCCEIPGADGPVWLGTKVDGRPTCDRESVNDPERCRPCTLSTTCFNPCGDCEVCVGRPVPPPNCGDSEMPQECPAYAPIGCGLPGQSGCSVDYYCITGCCTLIIK